MSKTTLETPSPGDGAGARATSPVPMLVVVWCGHAPSRVGEALIPREAPLLFGREEESAAPDPSRATRVSLVRQRPGANEATPPFDHPFVSRAQLRIFRTGDRIVVENTGKRALLLRGQPANAGEVRAGDVVELKGQMLFLCVQRPPLFAPLRSATLTHAFGASDPHGIVGESPAAWALRENIAFTARRQGHTLLLGESGTGKELVARAIHALSSRRERKIVARNAATLPSGLIDAELFGNVANYPNVGMADHPGLIGESNGSTLFLDEIGELPSDLQAHLLRVLDRGGEYQRLGEPRARTADFRLIAATNRDIREIKHDLAARMRLRPSVPGLNDRAEDIPLIARHLLLRDAHEDAELGQRFFEDWDGRRGEPRLDIALVEALVTHAFKTHVRELDALLWCALSSSTGAVAELTPEARAAFDRSPSETEAEPEITAETIRRSLARNAGVQEKVWRDLGLSSRHVLTRLMRKHGLESKG